MCVFSQIIKDFSQIFSGKKKQSVMQVVDLWNVLKYLHIYSTVPSTLKLFSCHWDRMTR